MGTSLTTFAIPLFVLNVSHSAFQLSVISALKVLPFAVLGLFIGDYIDEHDQKKILENSNLLNGMISLIIGVMMLYFHGEAVVPYLFGLVFFIGIFDAFYSISEVTYITKLFQVSRVPMMNSYIYGIQYACAIIVPAISGFFFSVEIVPYFFFFDGCSFIGACLLLKMLSAAEDISLKNRQQQRKNSIKLFFSRNLIAFKMIFSDKEVAISLVVAMISNLFFANFHNAMLTFLKQDLDTGNNLIGIFEAVIAVGGILGTLCAPLLFKWLSFSRELELLLLVSFSVLLAIFLKRSLAMIFMANFILEARDIVENILVISNRQLSIKTEYLGKVNSIFKSVLLGMMPIGYVFGGYLLHTFNIDGYVLTLIFVAVFLLLGVTVAFEIGTKQRLKIRK